MNVSIALPGSLGAAPRVHVQIHVPDALFDGIVGGASVERFHDPDGGLWFRTAQVTLPCGHEAAVFGSPERDRTRVEVVAHG